MSIISRGELRRGELAGIANPIFNSLKQMKKKSRKFMCPKLSVPSLHCCLGLSQGAKNICSLASKLRKQHSSFDWVIERHSGRVLKSQFDTFSEKKKVRLVQLRTVIYFNWNLVFPHDNDGAPIATDIIIILFIHMFCNKSWFFI